MKILLTRPVADSEVLAARLEAAGHTARVAPVMEITATPIIPATLNGEGVVALAVTSRNAVAALTASTLSRDLPVYVVGSATWDAVEDAGFANVRTADGDVSALANLIISEERLAKGKILYLTGRHRAGDLVGALTTAGLNVEACVVYEAVAVDELPENARRTLLAGEIDAAMIYSPRSAEVFLSLIQAEPEYEALISALKNVVAIAISENVADRLGSDVWRSVITAPAKTSAGVIAALETVEQKKGVPPAALN